MSLPSPSVANGPYFVVPASRDPDFVQRPHIEAWLREHEASTTSPIALVGPGGYGKSHVALNLAHQAQSLVPDRSVFWVSCSTRATFEDSYRLIAESLQLARRHEPGICVLKIVSDWLKEGTASWLMVVDNADDYDLLFQEGGAEAPLATYLPNTSNSQIVVTTRVSQVAETLTGGNHHAVMQIDVMDSAAAVSLIRNKVQNGLDEDAAAQLAQLMDYTPLGMSLAAAYINQQQISIPEYIDNFPKSRSERHINGCQGQKGDHNDNASVPDSIRVAWQVTFDHIWRDTRNAADLLCVMSYLQHHRIPHDVIYAYEMKRTDDDSDSARKAVDHDLRILSEFSLIQSTADTIWSGMHRLVQVCTRNWIADAEQSANYRLQCLRLMADYFPSGKFGTWETCQKLMPHLEELLHEPSSDDSNERLLYSLLLHNVSNYYSSVGTYAKADRLIRQAIQLRERILGPEHCETLDSIDLLASLCWKQGRLDEGEMLGVQLVKTRKAAFGASDPGTLTSMGNLATVYSDQGRFQEAEELKTAVMDIAEPTLSVSNDTALSTMCNLASSYHQQGRWDEAEKLLERAIRASVTTLPSNHPLTLTMKGNLAATYHFQGRLKQGKAIFEEVTEARTAVLGADHPDTLSGKGHLASIYGAQGDFGKACEMYTDILNMTREKLGAYHPETTTAALGLGLTLVNLGKLEEAEELFRNALHASRQALGSDHPLTLSCIANVAQACYGQGRWDEAVGPEEEVMNARIKILGPDHPDTLIAMTNLSATYVALHRLEEAEDLEVRALEMRRNQIGIDHPDSLMSLNNLAFIYKALGRWSEAFELINDCIARRQKVLGMEHQDTKSSMHAKVTWEQQRYSKPKL